MSNTEEQKPKESNALDDMPLSQQVLYYQAEIAGYEKSFSLRWDADMRAIHKWQKETGKELIWPDHTDLCMWLLQKNDELRNGLDCLVGLKDYKDKNGSDISYQTGKAAAWAKARALLGREAQ